MDDDLRREISTLRDEIRRTNDSNLFRFNDSLLRMTGVQFLRGLAFGLGSVIGATIVVSTLAYLLAQVDFIPILGDWAGAIADEMRAGAR
ncbi:MAG: DUF5665 domain-containing protein [Brevirhabdus sp.]